MRDVDPRASSTTASSSRCSEHHARNIVCGFARLDGHAVGVVAQPAARSSPACSTSTRRAKAARFVRFCDAFNVPLVTFVDVPGFLPGTSQEWGGIIRHGAKLLYAYARGDGAEDHRHHAQGLRRRLRRHGVQAPPRATINVAWPTAEIAVMGPEGAVNIVYRERARRARRTPTSAGRSSIDDYRARFANPYTAAERGYLDDVIVPARDAAEAHHRARDAAEQARGRPPQRKHGNIPL